MRHFFYVIPFILIIGLVTGCNDEGKHDGSSVQENVPTVSTLIGGGCDGCDLMYIGMPADITPIDTSVGWREKGQKLIVSGRAYRHDGKTPAPNVIIYYWHTDNDGYYAPGKGMDEKVSAHGHIRGWVKTDEKGNYKICTIKPAPYPGQAIPAHIHFSIKEPDLANEYYPDDLNFEDDTLLTPYLKKYPQEKRCGSGIVKTIRNGDLLLAEHPFFLGLNIPGYPKP